MFRARSLTTSILLPCQLASRRNFLCFCDSFTEEEKLSMAPISRKFRRLKGAVENRLNGSESKSRVPRGGALLATGSPSAGNLTERTPQRMASQGVPE